MKQIVCNTKFKLDPFADGGSKRSVQIRELLNSRGIQYMNDPFELPKNVSRLQLVNWSFRAIFFIQKHHPEKVRSLSKLFKLIKYYALRIPIVIDKYKDQDVDFLWENTNDRNMLYLLKATGHRVIGMPHNIESLVHSKSAKALEKEVANLKHCDVVFAISKEETWLLRLLGLNAHYLPYFPPKDVESFLGSIRKKRGLRESNQNKRFLLLGSATNIPTRSGMQSLVDYSAKKDLPFDLLVAGYGTESLRKVKHSRITFLGTLSNEELGRALVETDGVIIYQPPTTGALTRIPEMLLAGVPVFSNFDANRNYFGVNGIALYNSFDELLVLLQSPLSCNSVEFTKDESAEAVFYSLLS